MRKHVSLSMTAALALLAAAGCAKIDPIQAPAPKTGSADFSVMAALGNSLTAGYQNNGLAESHQRRSYAALLAGQVGKEILSSGVDAARPGDYVIPGYADPGSPGTVDLFQLFPPDIEPIDNPGAPVNTAYPAVYNALAVPGANVHDVLTAVHKDSNPYYDLVLRGQGTMLQLASELAPTFVVLWIGPNDVLGAALGGDPALMTPVDAFTADFDTLVSRLLALPSSPKLALANVPDVTAIPFVTTVPPFVVNPVTQQPILVGGRLVPLIGPDGPLALPGASGAGDFVTLQAVPLMLQGYGLPPGIPGANGEPLPGSVILTQAETAEIQARVDALNQSITGFAASHGIPVADVNGLLRELNATGIEVGGVHLAPDFLTGGVFSLDGFHPADMGQAIVADEFIRVINLAYGAEIPPVNLASVMRLRTTGGPAAPAGPGWWLNPSFVRAVEAIVRSPEFRDLVER